jgi:hypothetical protein
MVVPLDQFLDNGPFRVHVNCELGSNLFTGSVNMRVRQCTKNAYNVLGDYATVASLPLVAQGSRQYFSGHGPIIAANKSQELRFDFTNMNGELISLQSFTNVEENLAAAVTLYNEAVETLTTAQLALLAFPPPLTAEEEDQLLVLQDAVDIASDDSIEAETLVNDLTAARDRGFIRITFLLDFLK